MMLPTFAALAAAFCVVATVASAQTVPSPIAPDIPPRFAMPTAANDYEKRDVMIPMRDGVKLHTVIVVPKDAKRAPMLLTRTPYDASSRANRMASPFMKSILPEGDEVFVEAGYIRVFQDIRGKYGSEGDYVVTRPLRGPLNDTPVDHSTDAWDTIDWLVKNVPESNGKVGVLGSSYEGFTVVMALVNPHPALKVAAPQSPMIDGWMGDDWFHYGAFRQRSFDFFAFDTIARGRGRPIPRAALDDYETFLRAGSAGDYARANGLDALPYWQKVHAHPAYDAYWREQALDRTMAAQPLKVPVMWIQGLWDQEDIYGAIHSWAAVEPKDRGNDRNFLVMGPWRHSQVNYEARSLGPLQWEGDTALQFRRDVLKPFFDQYLVDGAPKADTPPVLIYDTGGNHWDRFRSWPLACEDGCATRSTPLYLASGGALSFEAPAVPDGDPGYDEYVSDPAKPVPYAVRPIRNNDREGWQEWLVRDQRFVSDRPDVLVWQTPPLTKAVRVSGVPVVHLDASTSGTDGDWVVKLIDVHPDQVASTPMMGGYQLAIALDIFRGRYREGFESAKPLAANVPLRYTFGLPTVNHVFLPGHRIMVQVQSSLFPLYDRNPQTFVENIFDAKPSDYRKAVQRIWRSGDTKSFVALPMVEPEQVQRALPRKESR